MVIARLYRMEPIHSGTHFKVNLSPAQEILSVFSRNYSNCQDRHVCIRQIPQNRQVSSLIEVYSVEEYRCLMGLPERVLY